MLLPIDVLNKFLQLLRCPFSRVGMSGHYLPLPNNLSSEKKKKKQNYFGIFRSIKELRSFNSYQNLLKTQHPTPTLCVEQEFLINSVENLASNVEKYPIFEPFDPNFVSITM
jgi:hypothetical protein